MAAPEMNAHVFLEILMVCGVIVAVVGTFVVVVWLLNLLSTLDDKRKS